MSGETAHIKFNLLLQVQPVGWEILSSCSTARIHNSFLRTGLAPFSAPGSPLLSKKFNQGEFLSEFNRFTRISLVIGLSHVS